MLHLVTVDLIRSRRSNFYAFALKLNLQQANLVIFILQLIKTSEDSIEYKCHVLDHGKNMKNVDSVATWAQKLTTVYAHR